MDLKAYNSDQFTYDQWANQEPRVAAGEAIGAAFDYAFNDTGTGLKARADARKELERNGGKVLSPEEANAQYPEMDVPFREPVKANVARYLYDQHTEKSRLQQKMSQAPDDFTTKAGMFGAGLLAHLMDPWEFGANWLLGLGIGRLAGAGAFGKRVATAAKAGVAGTTGQRVLREGVESLGGNLVGNVAQEGFVAQGAIRDNEIYDEAAGMKSIVIGTLAGSALHLGIKEGANAMKSVVRNWNSLSPELATPVMRTAVSDLAHEVRPNPELIMSVVAKETDVNPELYAGKFSYNYEPMKNSAGKIFYQAAQKVDGSEALHVGDNIFGGQQLTDHPAVANVAAARSFSASEGFIHRAQLSDINPLQLNELVPDNLRDDFVSALTKMGESDALDLVDSFTAKELLQHMQGAVDGGDLKEVDFLALRDGIQAKGYNALVHDGSTRSGMEHSPHNVVELLDENTIKRDGYYSPDSSIRREPSPDEVNQAREHTTDFNNRTDFDNKRVVEMEEEMRTDPFSLKESTERLEQDLADMEEEMGQLAQQGLVTETEMKNFKEVKMQIERDHTLAKAAAVCVGA